MTPSQRTILIALASGAAGFVLLFALGVIWPLAAVLAAALAVSVWLSVNYLSPSDKQNDLEANFRQIAKAADRIKALSARVFDGDTRSSLQAGCDRVPRMIEIIRQRDVPVALPLSQRTLAYLTDVASTLEDYIDVQDGGDPEYIRLGQQELKRLAAFTSQPDKDLSARRMDDYINSLTALNLNPPPELT
jgi:membrane protein implicated in regulation of membrane protease activity